MVNYKENINKKDSLSSDNKSIKDKEIKRKNDIKSRNAELSLERKSVINRAEEIKGGEKGFMGRLFDRFKKKEPISYHEACQILIESLLEKFLEREGM